MFLISSGFSDKWFWTVLNKWPELTVSLTNNTFRAEPAKDQRSPQKKKLTRVWAVCTSCWRRRSDASHWTWVDSLYNLQPSSLRPRLSPSQWNTEDKTSDSLNLSSSSKVSAGLSPVLVLYLSLEPVEEILLDSPERLCELQDVVIWVFTVGDLTDVHHLAGAALNKQHKQKSSGQIQTVVFNTSAQEQNVEEEEKASSLLYDSLWAQKWQSKKFS